MMGIRLGKQRRHLWAILAGAVCLSAAPSRGATPPGTSITNSARATYFDQEMEVTVTSNAAVTAVAFSAGARIDPDAASATGAPGAWAYIPHRLINSGNGADSFNVYVSGPEGWPAVVLLDDDGDGRHGASENTRLTSADDLAAGGSLHVLVAARAPAEAAEGDQGVFTLAMRSRTQTDVRVTASDTVSVVYPGKIAGKVRAPAGLAAGEARVAAVKDDAAVASATPASDGSYEMSGLPLGEYELRLTGDGMVPLRRAVLLTAEGPTASVDLTAVRPPVLKSGLNLVTIPFRFTSPELSAVTGPLSGSTVTAWAPEPTGGHFLEVGRDPQFPQVAPGVGYLWRESQAGSLPVLQPAAEPGSPVSIPLHPGWNLIGAPALEAVPLSSLAVKVGGQTMSLEAAAGRGLVCSYCWGYDPALSAHFLVHESFAGARRILEPWMAYWIHSSTDCELALQDGAGAFSLARASQAPAGESWTAQLSVSCGQESDRFKYFGVASDAGQGEDPRYSLRSPPSASGQSLELAFTPLWARAENGRFATDIRQPSAGKTVWDFVVTTSVPDATVTLSWPDLSRVPRKYQLRLMDLATGRRRAMKTTTSYSFTSGPAGSERQFQVEADPSPVAPFMISSIAQMPAQGAVLLSYTISQGASVSAEIRALTGGVVRRIASAQQVSPGTNLMSWDGRDQSGRVVSAGPYLCVLTASGTDGEVAKQSRTVTLIR